MLGHECSLSTFRLNRPQRSCGLCPESRGKERGGGGGNFPLLHNWGLIYENKAFHKEQGLGSEPPFCGSGGRWDSSVTKLPRNDSGKHSSLSLMWSAESCQPLPSLYTLHSDQTAMGWVWPTLLHSCPIGKRKPGQPQVLENLARGPELITTGH